MKFNNLNNWSVAGVFLLVTVAILLIIFWPLFLVWSLNTLFVTLSIPYTFWTWLAVVVLQTSTFGGIQASLNKLQINYNLKEK